jgi:hypothetical protein
MGLLEELLCDRCDLGICEGLPCALEIPLREDLLEVEEADFSDVDDCDLER